MAENVLFSYLRLSVNIEMYKINLRPAESNLGHTTLELKITVLSHYTRWMEWIFNNTSANGCHTGPYGAVAKSLGWQVLGSHLITGFNLERVFKGPMALDRCMATTPSSFSLTSNRVNTNY